PIQEGWIFKEKKFENLGAPAATGGGLGSTASGQTVYEGLPRDEDLEVEAAAAAAAEQTAPYGQDDDDEDDKQPPPPPPSTRGRRPDLGILA
ncbi:MAG TPA: hypothetical protein VEJ63_08405, partial [Planctomycetota bacterium]|nr:hypothetical protein [Planctomycetota bacterium]